METEDLSKQVSLRISVGHLLLAWHVMSEKFSDLRSNEDLSEDERRAIWGLADLLERTLDENGIGARPELEWNALVGRAREFAGNIPVDCLD